MAKPTAQPASDLDQLQGTWYITALEMDGQPAPPMGTIEISGWRFQSLGMGAVYEGDLRLDESAKPKTFDLAFTAGPEKGNTALGIYDLKRDAWKICFTVTAKSRPTKFATTPGSGLALETLQREKPAAFPPKQSKPRAADPALNTISGEWAMVSNVRNGVPLDPQYVPAGRRTVVNGVMTVTVMGQSVLKANVYPDDTQSPMTVDYDMGGPKGTTQLGIYKLEDDVLTTCIAAPGDPRPAGFSSEPGSNRTLSSWRLVKH